MFSYWREHSTLIVRIETELDQRAAAQIRGELDGLLRDPMIRHLVLDLSGITFMDSSGIAVLLRIYKRVSALGGTVTVSGAPAQALRVLKTAGLHKLLSFTE